ncbi:uncharacterized protein LOC124266400 [Haliotis rubra]|uniref:uncharacterized protein LOC124266400 n=1 Tax=Haliotis rubra TaxID=36100 RepID=UPI001EE54E0B|nr:uncharacterized protein LOC124266400 [Haliotis rubra]
MKWITSTLLLAIAYLKFGLSSPITHCVVTGKVMRCPKGGGTTYTHLKGEIYHVNMIHLKGRRDRLEINRSLFPRLKEIRGKGVRCPDITRSGVPEVMLLNARPCMNVESLLVILVSLALSIVLMIALGFAIRFRKAILRCCHRMCYSHRQYETSSECAPIPPPLFPLLQNIHCPPRIPWLMNLRPVPPLLSVPLSHDPAQPRTLPVVPRSLSFPSPVRLASHSSPPPPLLANLQFLSRGLMHMLL